MTTLEQISAPLARDEIRFSIYAPAWTRGSIRKLIADCGLDHYESKTFLQSSFLIRGKLDNVLSFYILVPTGDKEFEAERKNVISRIKKTKEYLDGN